MKPSIIVSFVFFLQLCISSSLSPGLAQPFLIFKSCDGSVLGFLSLAFLPLLVMCLEFSPPWNPHSLQGTQTLPPCPTYSRKENLSFTFWDIYLFLFFFPFILPDLRKGPHVTRIYGRFALCHISVAETVVPGSPVLFSFLWWLAVWEFVAEVYRQPFHRIVLFFLTELSTSQHVI